MNSPTFQARRLIFMLDGSNNVDSRKDVPFVGFIDIVPHFGMKYPQNPKFWGANRRFQAKQANFRILKIQDGGGCHLQKSQKSRYLHNGLTDLYEIWYTGAKWAS